MYVNNTLHFLDSTAPLDLASSSCRSSSRPADPSNRSPPACIRWASSLHALLQDVEGVKLFRQVFLC